MIQIVPLDPNEGPFICEYCGLADLAFEAEGAYIIDEHPGFYFCSQECAEDWEYDEAEEN